MLFICGCCCWLQKEEMGKWKIQLHLQEAVPNTMIWHVVLNHPNVNVVHLSSHPENAQWTNEKKRKNKHTYFFGWLVDWIDYVWITVDLNDFNLDIDDFILSSEFVRFSIFLKVFFLHLYGKFHFIRIGSGKPKVKLWKRKERKCIRIKKRNSTNWEI